MQIASQLYTIREAFAQDHASALARVRALGYEYVELAGLGGHDVLEVRRALRANGIAAFSMHVALERLLHERDAVVDEALALGAEHVVVPWLDEAAYRADGLDGYRRAARELAELRDQLATDDLALHYHNHDFEFAAVDAVKPLDLIVEAGISLELDLGWVQVAGEDPIAWLARAAGRVPLAHFKDVAPVDAQPPGFRPLGEGVIDWSAVARASDAAGVAWAVVEDDDALDPFASLERSRRHLQALGLIS